VRPRSKGRLFPRAAVGPEKTEFCSSTAEPTVGPTNCAPSSDDLQTDVFYRYQKEATVSRSRMIRPPTRGLRRAERCEARQTHYIAVIGVKDYPCLPASRETVLVLMPAVSRVEFSLLAISLFLWETAAIFSPLARSGALFAIAAG
jgi:hypothetical protein